MKKLNDNDFPNLDKSTENLSKIKDKDAWLNDIRGNDDISSDESKDPIDIRSGVGKQIAEYIRTGVRPFGDDYLIHGAINNIYYIIIAPLQQKISEQESQLKLQREVIADFTIEIERLKDILHISLDIDDTPFED